MQSSQERTCSLVSFQSATDNFIEKETSHINFLWILRNILGAPLLWKTSCKLVLTEKFYEKWRNSYYNKQISWSWQLFQRTDIVRESVNLRTTYRNLALNLTVVFNSFTDISFLKKCYWNILYFLLFLGKNIWKCFKVQFSVAVSVHFIK